MFFVGLVGHELDHGYITEFNAGHLAPSYKLFQPTLGGIYLYHAQSVKPGRPNRAAIKHLSKSFKHSKLLARTVFGVATAATLRASYVIPTVPPRLGCRN